MCLNARLTAESSWFNLTRVRSLCCWVLCGLSLTLTACGSSSSNGGSGGTNSAGADQNDAGKSSAGGSSGGAAGAQASAGAAQAGTVSTGGGGASQAGGSAGKSAEGGSSGDEPDLPGEVKIKALDDAQRAVLCDWYASKLGGYGHETECLTGSVKVYDSQAQCVEVGLRYQCPIVTIAQVVECTLGQVPSGGCDRPDEHCHWLDCM
jgi:hypothetical protein